MGNTELQREKEGVKNLGMGWIRSWVARAGGVMPPAQEGLRYWRERILFALVASGTLLSGVSFVPALILSLREELWLLLVCNTAVLGAGVVLLLCRSIPYGVRASVSVLLIYLVGVYVMILVGPLSGGPIWLFAFGVMCGVLLGLRAAIAGACINCVTLCAFGWLYIGGHWGQEFAFFQSVARAAAAGGSFVLLNLLAAISCAVLVRGLQFTAQRERKLSQSLEREKDQLIEAKKKLENEILHRREIEASLSESEERYRQILNDAPAGIFEIGFHLWGITSVNEVMCEYTGYTKEEFLSLNPLGLFSEDSRQEFVERGRRLFSGEPIPESTEYKMRAKDGREFWVRFHSRVGYEQGVPSRARVVVHDISGLKETETEKQRLEGRLQEARKMEAIATLAGGVAHQFNNALNVISLSLEGLALEASPAETARFFDHIRLSTEKMCRLTEQLLAYARGGKYRVRVIPMGELLEATLPLVEHSIQPPVRFHKDIPDRLWSVGVDVIQLQMVLSAILSNACEAIEGEGWIRVTCRNEEIRVVEAWADPDIKPGRYVCITVEDSGRGMDEETRTKIFEPFFTTKFQGRGLGMAAVHGIIRNHGGFVSVESALGKGTRVRICLPAAEESRKSADEPLSETSPAQRTILVIEDEEAIMELMQTALERCGYKVLAAETGEDAIREATGFEGAIDLAILDMVLPDMDGGQVYRAMKEARPGVKVILTSGYSVEGPARALLHEGAHSFLQKPFTMEHLSEKLKDLLGA